MNATEHTPFPAERLAGSAPDAAVALLGARLVREVGGQLVVARIVETEAYDQSDPASHSFRGRTARTAPMFDRAGTAYVYRSYGVHWCLNVTAGEVGHGAAVLLRAAVVEHGRDLVRQRRGHTVRDRDLLRGPGRLTAGLDVDAARHDGTDLLDPARGAGLWLAAPDTTAHHASVHRGPRVGVSVAADRPWRFHLDVPEVSTYRRSPRAPVR